MKKEQEQAYVEGVSLNSHRRKNQMAIFKRTRLYITLIASVLGLYFGFLQISGIEAAVFKNDEFADTLMKIALLIYYLAWLNGMLMDLKDEEAIFILPPNRGKYTLTAFFTILMIGVLFFFLCSFKSKQIFVLILDVFFILNIFSWKYLIGFISNSVKENKEFYTKENKNFRFIYIKLLIDEYLKGNWQWWRFGIGITLLIGINILVFTNLSITIAGELRLNSAELVKALGFFIFIIVFEGWVWFMRLRRRISLELIDSLDEDYYLTRRNK